MDAAVAKIVASAKRDRASKSAGCSVCALAGKKWRSRKENMARREKHIKGVKREEEWAFAKKKSWSVLITTFLLSWLGSLETRTDPFFYYSLRSATTQFYRKK